MITRSIEINRRPEDVFAYLDALERHVEWQTGLVSARIETEGPVRVGTRVAERRSIGGREQNGTYEITEHDPPHRSSFRGLSGPIRPRGTVTIEPVGDGSRTRLTLEFELDGHGFGKLIAPLARLHAAKTVPRDHERLKARLENGA